MSITVKDLTKIYHIKNGEDVRALDGVSFELPERGLVFFLGKSGSGKSTMLNVLGGLDAPDSGEMIIGGKSSKDFSPADYDGYRNTCVGFVFQEYNILPEFNVEQNVALALQLQGKKHDKEDVERILEKVDLAGMGSRKPQTLSGGQKQRVAIARALVKEPQIILADEPTGALDSATGKDVFETLKKLSAEKLVIVVSHDREFAEQYGDRIIELKDGKVISDVSKRYREAEQISGNVRKIDDNTVELSGELTEEEFRGVYEMVKSQSGHMLLSSDPEQVERFKTANRISPEGNREYFDDTTAADIPEKQSESTDFLKSRMPIKHAIKMGAVSLKSRPFRLILTILSSVLAFALFGFVSTVALYDVNYTVASALEGTAYDSVVLEKFYQVKQDIYHESLQSKYEMQVEHLESDIREAIEESELDKLSDGGLEFAGVYGPKGSAQYGVSRSINIENLNYQNRSPYYSFVSFKGFCDAGEEYLFKVFGQGARLAGRYPTAPRELAVSEYTYNMIAANQLLETEGETTVMVEIESYDDLLGQTLVVDGDEYTVTGIYRTGSIDERFDLLKNIQGSPTDKKDSDLLDEFLEAYSYSFHTMAYVSDSFRASFDAESASAPMNTSTAKALFTFADVYDTNGGHDNVYFDCLLSEWTDYFADYITAYDMTGQKRDSDAIKNMADDEIWFPLGQFVYRLGHLAEAKPSDDDTPYKLSHPDFLEAYTKLEIITTPNLDVDLDDYALTDEDMKVLLRALNDDWDKWVKGSEGEYGKIGDGDKFYYKGGSLKIAGVYFMPERPGSGDSGRYIVTRNFVVTNASSYSIYNEVQSTKYVSSGRGVYAAMISPLTTSRGMLNHVLGYDKPASDDSLFIMSGNATFSNAQSKGEMFAEYLWIYLLAALGMGIIAGLFLFNYISVSIMDKQREVGILRALGAKGTDVFKIFVSESIILALICALVAMVLAIIACVVGNYLFATSALAIQVFHFGFLNALILFGLAILVAALATILPVYFAAKKKPVDSIRSL